MKRFLFPFLILMASLVACTPNTGKQSSGFSDPVFERVTKTRVIRAGYIPYPPSFIVDPNTKKMSGISYDILVQAADNLGWEVEFIEELGWGSMIEAVDSGRVDIVATSIWPTAARGKKADFLTPTFYSNVKAYVRDGDVRFDNNIKLANSPDIKIAVMDGEMAGIISNADFPNAQQVSLTQISSVSELLLEISTKKADITFTEPSIALEYMAKNPETIREVQGVGALRLFPNSFLVKKGSFNFQNTMNIAIEEIINSGQANRIIDQYEAYPSSFGRTKSPAE